jgi:hypothetical protein
MAMVFQQYLDSIRETTKTLNSALKKKARKKHSSKNQSKDAPAQDLELSRFLSYLMIG